MQGAVIKYARSGEVRIAYQVIGHGSLDVVMIPGFPSNLDILWEDPEYRQLVKRLSAFCRLVLFDPRGIGLSDAVDPRALTPQQAKMDDICAVMEAVGSGRAAFLGASDGAALALLFAATYPKRTRALVLHGAYANFQETVMDSRRLRVHVEATEAAWGMAASLARLAPGRAGDPVFTAWWARLERLSASPTAAVALTLANGATDVRGALVAVDVPTLLLHRTEDAHVPVHASRYLAKVIRGARLVELPGRDHAIWMGDVDTIADLTEEFLTGERTMPDGDRVLAVLLVVRFAGDKIGTGRHGQERIELLRDALPRIMARHGGHAQWFGPERLNVRFDGAARAVACAVALRETAVSFGLTIAQGIHAGEIDAAQESLSGQALDAADRIAGSAHHAEILLSRLASELVSGTGLQFVDRGSVAVDGTHQSIPVVGLASERHLEPLGRGRQRATTVEILSVREREVLELVADGLSNPHIANKLGLSEHTVKRHVSNILLKLDMPTRAAAAVLVARGVP